MEDVLILLFDKIKTAWINVKYGVANYAKWFPTVWNDRDWDEYYLYKVMKFKLNKMAHLHKYYDHSTESEQTASQLKAASDLCGKPANYDYSGEALQNFREKYPDFELEITFDLVDDESSGVIHFNTEVLPPEGQELYNKHYQIADNLKKGQDELLKLMKSKIDG